jgi:hypothetical protein
VNLRDVEDTCIAANGASDDLLRAPPRQFSKRLAIGEFDGTDGLPVALLVYHGSKAVLIQEG